MVKQHKKYQHNSQRRLVVDKSQKRELVNGIFLSFRQIILSSKNTFTELDKTKSEKIVFVFYQNSNWSSVLVVYKTRLQKLQYFLLT